MIIPKIKGEWKIEHTLYALYTSDSNEFIDVIYVLHCKVI